MLFVYHHYLLTSYHNTHTNSEEEYFVPWFRENTIGSNSVSFFLCAVFLLNFKLFFIRLCFSYTMSKSQTSWISWQVSENKTSGKQRVIVVIGMILHALLRSVRWLGIDLSCCCLHGIFKPGRLRYLWNLNLAYNNFNAIPI